LKLRDNFLSSDPPLKGFEGFANLLCDAANFMWE
jgi:hypothetical protein